MLACRLPGETDMHRMMRTALLAVLLVFGPVLAGTPLPDGPHVVVAGEAKVTAPPDLAKVRFDFLNRAATAPPTKQKVDAWVNTLLDDLARFSVGDADIRASDLSVEEDVEYTESGRPLIKGFIGRRTVTVTLRDLSRLNELLDAGLAAGAGEIGNITLQSSRAEELRKEAKRKAVADARVRATGLAESFGARLGPVYSIDSAQSQLEFGYGGTTLDRVEVGGSRMQRGRYLRAEVEYRESVRAVFELQR